MNHDEDYLMPYGRRTLIILTKRELHMVLYGNNRHFS